MAHPQQRAFFESVKTRFPERFARGAVLECGSLNVNGTLRDLFAPECFYLGIDIQPGPCVDVLFAAHALPFVDAFDAVVSGEMLEHSEFWADDLRAIHRACKPGGLIAISCAGPGRAEHGTRASGDPIWNTSPDYYRNLSVDDIRSVFEPFAMFHESQCTSDDSAFDTYFYGIKR